MFCNIPKCFLFIIICFIFSSLKLFSKINKKILKNRNHEYRVEAQLSKMGYAKEAKQLIEKYWNQVEYLKTAREKALYMIA